MGLTDKLSDGLETIAQQAQKALDQGRVRVEQLQVERRMDVVARRIGYMEFDASRGRAVDQAAKDELLRELGDLEDELHATAAADSTDTATADADAGRPSDAPATGTSQPSPGTDMAEAERIAQAAAAAGVQPGTAQPGEAPTSVEQPPVDQNDPPKEG